MNGFRVTLLVLFTLTVGLMFYALTVLLPARQEQYELYRTTLKINEYQQRNEAHTARMAQLGAEVEAPEVSSAREAAEEAEKKRQQEIDEAEESSVLASAKRKEAERNAQEAAEPQPVDVSTTAVLGHVTSYSEDWNSIMFKPETESTLNDGLVIAVRRGNYVVCEAVVDGRDEQSGQVSATVKQAVFGTKGATETPKPQNGDEIILSPFLSGQELRGDDAAFSEAVQQMKEGEMTSPAEAEKSTEGTSTPAADMPVQPSGAALPGLNAPAANDSHEVEATLTPVP